MQDYDLAGTLRAAYALARDGHYLRAQAVLNDALDGVGPGPDEDILLTCLEWLRDTAAVFHGSTTRPAPVIEA
ncbi:MAG TPA: hypothetical protein VNT60_06135 [Deinococcales bacterium]|nr:hypothetical protein [Deinococcales bacterium]